MSVGMTFDTSRLDRAFAELAKESTRTDAEIVKFNAIDIMKSIAANSPRRTGNMNAGWRAGWSGLNIPGSPNTSRITPTKKGGRTYVPAGYFTDQSKSEMPTIEFGNQSHMLMSRKLGGESRVNYPFIVEARQGFMAKAEADVGRKLERRLAAQYRKLMKARG